jgi:hypothetical protein
MLTNCLHFEFPSGALKSLLYNNVVQDAVQFLTNKIPLRQDRSALANDGPSQGGARGVSRGGSRAAGASAVRVLGHGGNRLG